MYSRWREPVETQDFASPGEEYTSRNGGDMLVSAVSFACETQDFASLLG